MTKTKLFWFSIVALIQVGVASADGPLTTGEPGRCTPMWSTADLVTMGMISVTDPSLPGGGATPDEASDDDTDAIQEAVFRAVEACVNESVEPTNRYDTSGCKTVYFPPGTYHVSDTIQVLHPLQPKNGFLNLYLNAQRQIVYDGTDDGVDNGSVQPPHGGTDSSGSTMRRRSNVLVGSRCGGSRPTIKLKSGSQGFDSAASPRALVHYFAQCRDSANWACGGPIVPGSTLPEHNQSTIGFHDVFRGIDIDVSGGFAGAIGLRHAGAQGSAIEDVTISADGAYAGIEGIPGQGGGAYNIRVDGGRHGVITGSQTAFGLLVGATLMDQTERAIRHTQGKNPLVVVGFHVRKSVSTGGAPIQSSNGYMNSIVMVSGLIDVAQTGAIDVEANQAVYLRDVHVKGHGATVVDTPIPMLKSYDDQHVIEWAYTPASINGDTPQSLEDGVIYNGERIGVDIIANMPAPVDVHGALIQPHIWDEDDLPSFEDPGSTIVLAGGDIQAALDASADARVFLAGGRHTVSDTVRLGANDKLAGLDRSRTVIETSDAWSQTVIQGTPIVHAAADVSVGEDGQSEKTGTAAFGRMSLQESVGRPYFTHTRWEIGRNSTLRGIIFGPDEAVNTSFEFVASEDYGLEWGANGGGRVWGYQPEGATVEWGAYHPNYRQFFSNASTEPISIYGMNCEKAHSDYICEFRNATDIDVYMLKSETCHQCYDGNRPMTVGGVFTGGDDKAPGASGPTDRQPILKISQPQRVRIFGAGGNAAPTSGNAAVIEFADIGSGDYLVAVYGPNANTGDSSMVFEKESGQRVGNATPGDDKARMVGYVWRSPDGCAETCASIGAQCGTVCGEICGVCDAGNICDINNQCMLETPPDPPLEIIVDNLDPNTQRVPSSWWTMAPSTAWDGDSVTHHWGQFKWLLDVPQSGDYAVYAWWNGQSYYSSQVPYRIQHAEGLDTVFVSQKDPSTAGQWILLGTFPFDAGVGAYIEVSAENGFANADAVRLVLGQGGGTTPPGGDPPPSGGGEDPKLVGYWSFDDVAGNAVLDGSENGLDGILAGTASITTGNVGSAAQLDGASGYVAIAHADGFNTPEFTASAWVRPASYQSYQRILGKGYYESGQQGSFYVNFSSPAQNRVSLRVNVDGSFVSITSVSALPLDTWTHLAFTYDGERLRIHVNGNLDSESLPVFGNMTDSTVDFAIGTTLKPNGNPQNRFHGAIDEVRFYRRALTSSEIDALL